MKVHHLNCGSLCPHGQRLLNGHGGWLAPAELCCHCLLLETRHGLVLVDAGFGLQDIRHPHRLGAAFRWVSQPLLQENETAMRQIEAMGFEHRDVRHIVLTHLDLDHAGGMADFPQALVHIHRPELQAAYQPATLQERGRYRAMQWQHVPRWVIHEEQGETWLGFKGIRALPGTDDEVLLIPLPGHTRGHCAIAVHSDTGWLLHAGDAYFFHGEIEQPAHCPAGLKVLQNLLQFNGQQRRHNQTRLQQLAQQHRSDLKIFCAHDPLEWQQLSRPD